MPVVAPAPASIRDCEIYRQMLASGSPDDGLVERVEVLVATTSPLLDLIVAGPFRDYTLHNPDHAKKLVHLTQYLLRPETLSQLSRLECALILYAAYVHDLGMCLTSIERLRLLNSPDFLDHLRSSEHIWGRLTQVRDRQRRLPPDSTESQRLSIELEAFQLQEVALASYLRPHHATRATYERLFETLRNDTGRADLFEYKGVSFADVLIDICESHNMDVGVLAEVKGPYDSRLPRDAVYAGQKVNSQFCAAILRLTDVLDFDRERTPSVLFENLGIPDNDLPGADITLKEWRKHMAVHTIDISEHEVVFSGDSHHPAIEASVRAFTHAIETEIRDTLSVRRNNPAHVTDVYSLTLPAAVRARMRSIGYVFHDVRMRLNESAIILILMGERLYNNGAASIRELIQNGVDACALRARLSSSSYSPLVEVAIADIGDGVKWLEVRDNGIGMDQHVISEYLFQIGNSYYDSPEFDRVLRRASAQDFVPVSRFGIGIVSVFMIGNLLEVTTANPLSVRGDKKQRTIRVDGRGGLAFITEQSSGEQGTLVRVRLKADFATDQAIGKMSSFIREVVLRPKCRVAVSLGAERFVRGAAQFMSLAPDARTTAAKYNVEFVFVDLAKFSESLSGVIVIPFSTNGKQLELGDKGVVFDRVFGIDPSKVFKDYDGNRFTVNGFRMGLKKANRLFGRRLRFAYDIDVKGDKDVVFDVARDRIIGDGLTVVRQRMRDAILLGLMETGVFEKLDMTAREYVQSNRLLWGNEATGVDDKILASVAELIPNGPWPIGLHREIADRLQMSGSKVRTAISLLLESGRIPDGRNRQRKLSGG